MSVVDARGLERPTPNPGHYAKKQLLCKNPIIAWSHRSRFKLARELVKPYAGKRLLDYGCGDGTFLAEVHDLFRDVVGADIDVKQTLDCRTRFASFPAISFVLTRDLDDPAHAASYEVITCMEVLEHCLDDGVEEVLISLRRLVSPTGVVLVSVPIEIGPTLIGKQVVRKWAGWRGLGDYKYSERYTAHEMCRMIFARESTALKRPVYSSGDSRGRYHAHKGFNWRALRKRLQEHFDVQRSCFSPLGWFGSYLSSQAWFICKAG